MLCLVNTNILEALIYRNSVSFCPDKFRYYFYIIRGSRNQCFLKKLWKMLPGGRNWEKPWILDFPRRLSEFVAFGRAHYGSEDDACHFKLRIIIASSVVASRIPQSEWRSIQGLYNNPPCPATGRRDPAACVGLCVRLWAWEFLSLCLLFHSCN